MEAEQYLNKINNGLDINYASITIKLDDKGKVVGDLKYTFNFNKDISEASRQTIKSDLLTAINELLEEPSFRENNKGYKIGIFLEFTDEDYE